MNVLQLMNVTIPLSVVGVPGVCPCGGGTIILTIYGQGWTTGTATVTAVTTTTPGTATIRTVSLAGSDARTAGHAGTISLVSGFRMVTNVVGTTAGFAIQTLNFSVPEPSAAALLGAAALGAGALAVRGRRLRRRR